MRFFGRFLQKLFGQKGGSTDGQKVGRAEGKQGEKIEKWHIVVKKDDKFSRLGDVFEGTQEQADEEASMRAQMYFSSIVMTTGEMAFGEYCAERVREDQA